MNKRSRHFIQNMSMSDSKVAVNIQQKVDIALVFHVFKQSSIGLFTSLFCATILLISLYKIENRNVVVAWYIIFWLVVILRFILVKMYLHQSPAGKNLKIWRQVFTVGACLSGLCWGYSGGFLLPYDNAMLSTLTVMILAGMTAGAVPLLSGILSAAIVFLVATVLPLSIRLISINNTTYILFGVTSLVYLAYLIILSIKTHNMIKHAISLQFENDVLLHDLSDAKGQLELTNKKLGHAATHDFLTNLANRSLFEIEFIEAIQSAEQARKVLALFYLDIDNFKAVNDAYGHYIGDQLLQGIVERIKQKLPENLIAARLGGDEIAIVIDNIADPDAIAELAKQMCILLAKPFEIKDFNILIAVSIGISIYPVDGLDAEMLSKNADKAMYYVKERGGNNYHFNTDLITIKTAIMKSFPKALHF